MTGDEFRALRKSMKLTQDELAPLMGVTQATVSRWETNDMPIDMRTATTLRALSLQKAA